MKCHNCKLFGKCRQIRMASKEDFKWSKHNLWAHPLSEVIFLISRFFKDTTKRKQWEDWSNKIHDDSIPEHEINTGRG